MSEKDQTLRIGRAVVDLDRREVRIDGRALRLDPKSVDVLAMLVAERGRPVSREHLLDRCWADGAGSDEALTQIISQLRAAVGDSSRVQSSIRTLPKLGYLLVTDDDRPAEPVVLRETVVVPASVGDARHKSVLPVLALVLLALLAALIAFLVLGGNEEKTIVFKQPRVGAASPAS